jgi:hypothetical protein
MKNQMAAREHKEHRDGNILRPLQNTFFVAQTSQSAVSRISKSAEIREFPRLAELEFGDTAGLETCATQPLRGLNFFCVLCVLSRLNK